MNRSLAACTVLFAIPAIAGPEQSLFSGTDLKGWRTPTGTWSAVGTLKIDPADPRHFLSEPGQGVLLNSTGGKSVNILTELEHGDCELHLEFCVPKGSNSGVYLMGRYEVQILDSFGKSDVNFGDCGGLYERADPPPGGFKGRAPSTNASKPPGEWQSFDISFRAPRFDAAGKKIANAKFLKVTHNGQLVHENVEVDGPTRSARYNDEKPRGALMLQGDHGPVAFRKLLLSDPAP